MHRVLVPLDHARVVSVLRTAAGYSDQVSKAKAFETVQVFAPVEVQRLAKLKRGQIASEAERLAAGSGLLPQMLIGAVQASEALDEHEPQDHAALNREKL